MLDRATLDRGDGALVQLFTVVDLGGVGMQVFSLKVRIEQTTLRHATRHATLRHSMPRYATPRHAMPRHATPCHATHTTHMPHLWLPSPDCRGR